MKLTLMGTGTSTGVPVIGCKCPVCTSTDPRDHRGRITAMLQTDGGAYILIDCGPDFRELMLHNGFSKIDGVLITHDHFDHIGGLEDIRPNEGFDYDINVYCLPDAAKSLKERLPYIFVDDDKRYKGAAKFFLRPITPHQAFNIADAHIMPFNVTHHKPIAAYRIDGLTFITDMKSITSEDLEYVKGTRTLVVNGLRWRDVHRTHQTIEEALDFIAKINPERAYLIHMTHDIGLHDNANAALRKAALDIGISSHVEFAYDGLCIEC